MGKRDPGNAFSREPFIELPARLAWQTRYSEIVFSNPPYLILQAAPCFQLALVVAEPLP